MLPNWCSNRLTVDGPDRAALKRWSEAVAGTDTEGNALPLDFERVIPTPPQFLAGHAHSLEASELITLYLDSDFTARRRLAQAQPIVGLMAQELASGKSLDEVTLWDVTDWRDYSWGTKWVPAARQIRVKKTALRMTLHFDTAWSPPKPIVMALIQRHPELTFDLVYNEPASGFAGRLGGTRAEVLVDTETREPDEAVALLRASGWDAAAEDWLDPEDA